MLQVFTLLSSGFDHLPGIYQNQPTMTAKKERNQNRKRSRRRTNIYQLYVSPSQNVIGQENQQEQNKHQQPSHSFHPSLLPALNHLSRRLAPLLSVTTGQPHPAFPKALLQYHLLTSAELDSLAAHYHQVIPSLKESSEYPRRIPPWVDKHGTPVVDIPLETKRRRFGRFIGLKGCESPDGEGMLEAMERDWINAIGKGGGNSQDEARHLLGRKPKD